MSGLSKCRDFIQRHSVPVSAVALVVATFCLGSIAGRSDRSMPQSQGAYYLDMNTGVLFVAEDETRSSIDAPSGPLLDASGQSLSKPAGVRAYVFSCTDCSDQATIYIGWLERYERGQGSDELEEIAEDDAEGDQNNAARHESVRQVGQAAVAMPTGRGHAVLAFGGTRKASTQMVSSAQPRAEQREIWDQEGSYEPWRDAVRQHKSKPRRGQHLVSRNVAGPWVAAWSDDAAEIRIVAESSCPDGRAAIPCRPIE